MKTLLLVFVVIGVVYLTAKKHRTAAAVSASSGVAAMPGAAAVSSSPVAQTTTSGDVVIIEFGDPHDLLRKLREVKTGQRFELRDNGNHVGVSSGIACSDKEAVAKYEKEMNAELAQLNDAINAELKRIQGP